MYDPDDIKIINTLRDQFGEAECLRLGFLGKDDNATLYVSAKGLGYLLEVVAGEITLIHESYAAGYDQGYNQAKDGY